ncbi:MAG TPA: hypothetical protein PKK72_11390 [Chitinophagales bacterium]|nr:hypothetical protein [Chitinophagales bacterium]HMU69308.1 hypothetical protein [Chitinophagales bacterium]HMZ88624.1 hypothetical protein [Chitinophagales bacterium]HNA57063.1 hypothetical protein [Chitinophagales bacterium]HNE44722.1 hypothetical protein [Chitinophagales bacterium]
MFNIRNSSLALLLPIAIGFLASGCTSLPGDGGTSTIHGKIYVERYNEFGTLYQDYYGPDERVYIIYGDNIGYDDEVKTSFDGTYKFPFLRKGTYTIYAYSDCLTCDGNTEARSVQVEITENNQDIEVEDIVIEAR